MFIICDFYDFNIGHTLPYQNIQIYNNLIEAIEIALTFDKMLIRVRTKNDFVFYDFVENSFIEWDYKVVDRNTGFITKFTTLEESLKYYCNHSSCYIIRKAKVNNFYHIQIYDGFEEQFIDIMGAKS